MGQTSFAAAAAAAAAAAVVGQFEMKWLRKHWRPMWLGWRQWWQEEIRLWVA